MKSKFIAFSVVFLSMVSTAWAADPVIDNRVPAELNPICEALSQHWGFLYERAAPEYMDKVKKVWTTRRIDFQSVATLQAIQILNSRGHEKGTGRALVMGGAYEVDLKPILENFEEVHVVDMTDEPLRLTARVYDSNPKLKFIRADLSGIPSRVQAKQLKVLMADVEKATTDASLQLNYFLSVPEKLDSIPFESAHYDLVVSPVLVESLSHGPLVAPFEAYRQKTNGPQKGMSDVLTEPFYYQAPVMTAFRRVFQHHSQELNRVLTKNGVATVSLWKRPDLKRAELAPQIPIELFRVGDDRISEPDFLEFFKPWTKTHELGGRRIYGEDKAPTMNMYVLEK